MDLLKENVIFINTSRGEVIDENYLAHLIKRKRIKFFATDVVSNEHLLPSVKSKIFDVSNYENVYITPHMAGLTFESEEIALKISINNLNTFFSKKGIN